MVDLSLAEGASVLDGACVRGRRLRYFAVRPMVDYLKSLDQSAAFEPDNSFAHQIASLIEAALGATEREDELERVGRRPRSPVAEVEAETE